MPPGYRLLTVDECHWIKRQIYEQVGKELEDEYVELSSGFVIYFYNGLMINQREDTSQVQLIATIEPIEFCISLRQNFQLAQIIKKHENILLPIGLVVKVKLNDQAPAGFRKMLIQQGYEFKEELEQILSEWSIVAFETGRIDGRGYGYKFFDSYGSQCGEIFVVYIAPF